VRVFEDSHHFEVIWLRLFKEIFEWNILTVYKGKNDGLLDILEVGIEFPRVLVSILGLLNEVRGLNVKHDPLYDIHVSKLILFLLLIFLLSIFRLFIE
jgi:hypothetical protein